jgi:hypothetical protein
VLASIPAFGKSGMWVLVTEVTVVGAEKPTPLPGALVVPFHLANYPHPADRLRLESQALRPVRRTTTYAGAPLNFATSDSSGRCAVAFAEDRWWTSNLFGLFLSDRPFAKDGMIHDTLLVAAPGRRTRLVSLASRPVDRVGQSRLEPLWGRIDAGVVALAPETTMDANPQPARDSSIPNPGLHLTPRPQGNTGELESPGRR